MTLYCYCCVAVTYSMTKRGNIAAPVFSIRYRWLLADNDWCNDIISIIGSHDIRIIGWPWSLPIDSSWLFWWLETTGSIRYGILRWPILALSAVNHRRGRLSYSVFYWLCNAVSVRNYWLLIPASNYWYKCSFWYSLSIVLIFSGNEANNVS